MRAEVISPFTDLKTDVVYLVGERYEGTAARLAELERGGFVKTAEEAPRRKPRAAKATKK